MTDWTPDLSASSLPRYLALADKIEQDIASGVLAAGERLPAQRRLAKQLGLDFTTVARGYSEARKRGVVSSQVGNGTFITGSKTSAPNRLAQRPTAQAAPPDFSMNLPPEPEDQSLIASLQESIKTVSADLVSLMRYQTLETSEQDLEAGHLWLRRSGLQSETGTLLIAPGAQSALNTILLHLARPGDKIACENITYPGIRSLCTQLRLPLLGLPTDEHGIEPAAFEETCKTHNLKALYLNPTLQNPTTKTIPLERRQALLEIADRYNVPILEDDPYSRLLPSAVPAFAALAPHMTWHISSLSKTVSAGLRIAYIQAPNKKAAWQASRVSRATHVMPSPMLVSLATRWIEDGTAAQLCSAISEESAERQKLVSDRLYGRDYLADPNGFHIWLAVKNGWTRSAFASQIRPLGLGVTESDAFTTQGAQPEAVRLCLGGPVSRSDLAAGLDTIANLLETSPEQASAYF